MENDVLKSYYLGDDYNCAETTLRFINDKYDLGLAEEDFKLVSGFGGGFGCGITCGALCACISAIGKLAVSERAHATPGFRELCGRYTQAFREAVGDTDCTEIKKDFFCENGTRCLKTVLTNAELFERFAKAEKLVKG